MTTNDEIRRTADETTNSNTVWLAYHGTHRGSAHIVGVFESEKEAEAALDNDETKIRDYECVEEMPIGEATDLLV